MRIDKFIWCVRLYKTRSISSKSVNGDRVKFNSSFTKPGKEIKVGDEIAIKVAPIWKTYMILDIPKSRIGAKLVADYLTETTLKEDLIELENLQLIHRNNLSMSIKGRPTKKDRRKLNDLDENN